jgi:hypothetical protein
VTQPRNAIISFFTSTSLISMSSFAHRRPPRVSGDRTRMSSSIAHNPHPTTLGSRFSSR